MSYHTGGIYYYYAPKNLKNCKQKNKFIPNGYFGDPNYFSDISEVLANDFLPKIPLREESSQLLLHRIENSNSVCVSLRKWDDEKISRVRSICNKEYYVKAIEFFESRISNPEFFIFSNDIKWAKENFEFPNNVFYETGENEIYEKMVLMSACKYFILSDSTFAWWAQYLGKDANKIVVCPEKWNVDEDNTNPLILSDFSIIDSHNE